MITIDMRDIRRVADNMKAAQDQVPYATALALNAATESTRSALIKSTWPTHVHVRNAQFISASLTTAGKRATKYSLSTEIYDRLNRGNLLLHATGGMKRPTGRTHMAVPVSSLIEQKGARGVPRALKPRNLGKRGERKGDAIFERSKTTGKLRLLYVLKTATKVPRIPFYDDFNRVMRAEFFRELPAALERAMRTRRPR